MGKVNIKWLRKIILWIVEVFTLLVLLLVGLDYWARKENAKSHTYIRINKYLQIKNTLNRKIKTIAHFTKEEAKYLKDMEKEYPSLSKERKESLDWKKQEYPKTPIYLLNTLILMNLPRLYNLKDIQLSVDLKREIYEFYIPANTSIILGNIESAESFQYAYISFEFIDETSGKRIFVPGNAFMEKALRYKNCDKSDLFNCKFVIDEFTFVE